VPEGLAIALVLVPRGVSIRRAALWGIISSLPQPLLAIPAYLAVESFTPLFSTGLGFAAGAMLWMAAHELVPEALEDAPANQVTGVIALSAALMLAVQAWLIF
jgi:zinc transporter ZupT